MTQWDSSLLNGQQSLKYQLRVNLYRFLVLSRQLGACLKGINVLAFAAACVNINQPDH